MMLIGRPASANARASCSRLEASSCKASKSSFACCAAETSMANCGKHERLVFADWQAVVLTNCCIHLQYPLLDVLYACRIVGVYA